VSETIRLDVAAALSAFTPVRMVLGGLSARLEFSVEEIDDLYLAAEQLFRAVVTAEGGGRVAVEMVVDGGRLRIVAGPFTSPVLRERVMPATPGAACLDLCRLLRTTCDDVTVDDLDGSYRVVLVKTPGARA